MSSNNFWEAVCNHLSDVTGDQLDPSEQVSIAGGCISQAFRLRGARLDYFVKVNGSEQLGMFEAEAHGLQTIFSSQSIRVPKVFCTGTHQNSAYLVLEFLSLGSGRPDFTVLGRNLAAMHRSAGTQFGWNRNNTIGSTAQINQFSTDWVDFWSQHRLGFQLRLAEKNGFGGALQNKGRQLMDSLDSLLDGHNPTPSLLHGDLWSGNYSFTAHSEPVIYDPAVYYGDREADIAMTELFGGFNREFYDAYWGEWPMEPGYELRKTLYNLYHILNHLNLFGSGYLSQAEGMIDRLLSEVR